MTRSAFPEFSTEEKAQHLHREINLEYPVNPTVLMSGDLASWGRFLSDNLLNERLVVFAPRAQVIIGCVRW